jgi:sec-independent protein translocase protein TatC
MKIKVYINELKYRLFFLFFTLAGNAILLYTYKEEVIFLLGEHQSKFFPYFISTNLTEIFFGFFKLTFSLALYFTFPSFIGQLWFFLVPALYRYEYEIFRNFCFLSIFTFFISTFLTLSIFLPYCWKFFSSFQIEAPESLVSIHMELRINDYLNFFLTILFSLTLIFHFFFIFLFFLKMLPLNLFIKFRKIGHFLIFILATLFTPPDLFSQILIASLFLAFFEIFLFSTFLLNEYKRV